ncbi:hypothetical protein ACU4GD_45405 [Cupriavidus basilensis]
MNATGRTPSEAAPDPPDRPPLPPAAAHRLRRHGGGLPRPRRSCSDATSPSRSSAASSPPRTTSAARRARSGSSRTPSHPSLVTLFDTTSDEEGRACVLVLEFVDGTDAGARLKAGAVALSSPCRGRARRGRRRGRSPHIHGRGVVHRDIRAGQHPAPERDGLGCAR